MFEKNKKYLKILLIYIIFTAIMTLIGCVAFSVIPHSVKFGHINPVKQNWINVFLRWDALNYANVAAMGYGVFSPGNYAFFPLYPALIWILTKMTTIPYFYSSLIISRLCFLGALLMLYKITDEEFGEKIALRSVICLMFFPGAFYFLSAYTESLSLLFVLCIFFYCKHKKWLLACVFAMLFSALKQVGIVMGIIILLEYLRAVDFKLKNIRPNILWVGLIPVGLVSYMIYLHVVKGNFLYFSYCEPVYYYRELQFPGVAFFNSIKMLAKTLYYGPYQTLDQIVVLKSYVLELFMTVADVAMIVQIFRKLDKRYFIYSLLIIIIPFCTGVGNDGLCGMLRYSILLFPMYFIAAKLLEKKNFKIAYISVGIILNCILMGLFACWYWVA